MTITCPNSVRIERGLQFTLRREGAGNGELDWLLC